MNSVAELNQFCHKNRLNFSFKLIKADGPAHDKNFDVCLYIQSSWSEKKCCLEFFGKGKSIKKANANAAADALSKDLIKLLEKIDNQNDIKTELDLSSNSNFSSNTIEDKPNEPKDFENKFSDLYSMAEQLNLFIDIDHVWTPCYLIPNVISIILKIDNKNYSGIGSTDVEAIQKAVESVNINFKIDKNLEKNFQPQINENFLFEINIQSQRLKKDLEFNCILQIGIPQLKFVVYKCTFGKYIAYGLGKNKKIAKNLAAKKIISLLESDQFLNLVKMEALGILEGKQTNGLKNYDNILNSGLDPISILHVLDSNRKNPSLDFTYKKEQVFQNFFFTVECFLQYDDDLGKLQFLLKNTVKKNNLVFLKTTSKNTKKKIAKMEAAEKMVNLLQGKPPTVELLQNNLNHQPVEDINFYKKPSFEN